MELVRLRVYVAAPYSSPTLRGRLHNTKRAMAVGLEVWRAGHFPYVPHLSHYLEQFNNEQIGRKTMTWDDWMEWDREWLDTCNAILVVDMSPGVSLELERAKQRGLKVFHSVHELPRVESR